MEFNTNKTCGMRMATTKYTPYKDWGGRGGRLYVIEVSEEKDLGVTVQSN